MLFITSCNDWHELGNFLKEWTGKDYKLGSCLPANQYYLVAKDDNKIVGCACFIVIGDPFFNRTWALVENVYVTPQYRGKGVGKRLMQSIETNAKEGFGCEFIKLTTRKELGKSLYRSLGYDEGSSFYS